MSLRSVRSGELPGHPGAGVVAFCLGVLALAGTVRLVLWMFWR